MKPQNLYDTLEKVNPIETFTVQAPQRVDKLLSKRFTTHSRSYFESLIERGGVTCKGKALKKRDIPAIGDEIVVAFTPLPQATLTPEPIPLDILYEDELLICINKPAGMVVHPAPGHPTGTCVHALLHHCAMAPTDALRPGIVHRLDKETSGALLAAKNSAAHEACSAAFAKRRVQKEYIAITVGVPLKESVEAPIGRHPKKRKEMALVESGRAATTHFERIASCQGFCYLKARPITGRTHQIRLHLAKAMGTPILGDTLYGPTKLNHRLGVKRHLLHARRLIFPHPMHGEMVEVIAPIPNDLQQWIDDITEQTLNI